MPETGGKQAYPVGKARGGEGMRRALEVYKENFPHIDAILVGTRRGDPHGGALSVSFLLSLADCICPQQRFPSET